VTRTKKGKCLNCSQEIDIRAIRCRSCAHKGFTHSEATKLKISQDRIRAIKISNSLKGKPSGMLGKKGIFKHTKETKKRQSEFMKEWYRNNPHPKGFLGKQRTKEYLETRSRLFSGERNPNWQGGKNFEPYTKEFNNKFKRAIRKRDNHICLKCGKHQEKEKRVLTIHHINYDKKLSIPQNCCAVCNKCNGEVNFNRKHWIKFFQSLLADKYGYKYEETKIVLEVKNESQYPAN